MIYSSTTVVFSEISVFLGFLSIFQKFKLMLKLLKPNRYNINKTEFAYYSKKHIFEVKEPSGYSLSIPYLVGFTTCAV
jgi:hypothetical protein